VGAELKSAVCLTRGRQALLSQHIGDLENLETLRSFEKTIAHLQRIFEIRPELVVHDLHPDYLSTRWARQQGLPCMAVQHHHAHIASVMAERKISGPVLGIALDGAGYGTDGTIWGGEMLWVEGDRMERLARMRRFRLAGGDQAVREPWRMALSALWSLDPEQPERTFADFFARWPADKARILLQMLRRGFHSPLTSSCGRLFDAVAALTGTRESISYEGQAAAELEQVLQPDDGVYRGKLVLSGDTWILDSLPMIAGIVQDIRQGHPPGIISARFHNGLVDLFKEAALRLREQTGLHRVALSGGVFQNRFLSEHLEDALTDCGMEIFVHEEAPPNDGCIALGQAYVGGCALRRRQKGEIERLSPQTGFRIGFL
jgi:hydrogenase maturation protein HypF